MNDPEPQQPIDDSKAEITPLDQPDTAIPPLHPHRFLAPLFSPHWRTPALRLSVVLSLVLLVLLALPGGFQTLRNTTLGMLSSLIPTPAPTLPPGYDNFYLDVSVPWTKVLLDGHLVRLPRNIDAPLKLARARHHIEWHAEPFQPQSCVVSIPFSLSDTCHFANDDELGQQFQDPSAQIILLHNSLTTLSTNQQTTLIDAVQKTLEGFSTNELVQPGELYVGPNGYNATLHPLKATLHFKFDVQATGNQPFVVSGEECQQLCIIPWQSLPSRTVEHSTAREWLSLIFVSSSWDYTALDGHLVAHNQPIDLGGAGDGAYPVLLRIRWDSPGWNVKALIGPDQVPPIAVSGLPHDSSTPGDKIQLDVNPTCVAARDLLLSWALSENFQVRFTSGPNPATGCLATVTSSTINAPTSSHSQVAYFLEHFGVLLAANDAAHELQSFLPLADAYEQHLAQQLAMFPG